jgi:hypothetical protein
VQGLGDGTGAGVHGTGGSGGNGVTGVGTAAGDGVHGTGGGTNGTAGVYGQGGTAGYGVEAQGTGAYHGVKSTGGTTGNGVFAVGGSGGGDGIYCAPGHTSAAALRLGSQAADPSSLVNGQIWYNSTSNTLKCRINGTTYTIDMT